MNPCFGVVLAPQTMSFQQEAPCKDVLDRRLATRRPRDARRSCPLVQAFVARGTQGSMHRSALDTGRKGLHRRPPLPSSVHRATRRLSKREGCVAAMARISPCTVGAGTCRGARRVPRPLLKLGAAPIECPVQSLSGNIRARESRYHAHTRKHVRKQRRWVVARVLRLRRRHESNCMGRRAERILLFRPAPTVHGRA